MIDWNQYVDWAGLEAGNYGNQNMGPMQGDAWLGDDNMWYSKDEYGNVFDQYGGFMGQDYQDVQPYSQFPYMVQNPGQATQYGGGAFQPQQPQRAANIPSDFVWNPQTGTFDAPGGVGGMGGGQMGGGQMGGQQQGPLQYPYQQESIAVEREKLRAGVEANKAEQAYKQQYLGYLQQQLADQTKTNAERLAIERERVQIERDLAALKAQEFQLAKESDEFKRGMQITETLGNPRSLVQSLMLLGANPAQAAGYLQNTPLVQGLGAPAGVGQQGGWAPPAGGMSLEGVQQAMGGLPSWQNILQSTSSASGGGTIDPTTGRNTLFPFISGRKMPVQQTLADIQSQSQNIPMIQSLASFSGQNPESFFGEFGQFLPKGSTLGPASIK